MKSFKSFQEDFRSREIITSKDVSDDVPKKINKDLTLISWGNSEDPYGAKVRWSREPVMTLRELRQKFAKSIEDLAKLYRNAVEKDEHLPLAGPIHPEFTHISIPISMYDALSKMDHILWSRKHLQKK